MTRKDFPPDIKMAALEKYNNRCYIKKCRQKFDGETVRPRFDHKNGDNSDNRLANCGPICPNCHDKKSRKENSKRKESNNEDSGGVGFDFGKIGSDLMGGGKKKKKKKKGGNDDWNFSI